MGRPRSGARSGPPLAVASPSEHLSAQHIPARGVRRAPSPSPPLPPLLPILAPRHLWEHANGLDSSGHVIATLCASPLAGTLVGVFGGEWALATSGAVYVAAAAVMLGLPDPRNKAAQVGSVLLNAWLGLKYTVSNSTLRGLALTLSTYNIGNGLLAIAVPVLVLGRLHSNPAIVGVLWGLMGGAGLASALGAGRMSRQGREGQVSLPGPRMPPAAAAALPVAGTPARGRGAV